MITPETAAAFSTDSWWAKAPPKMDSIGETRLTRGLREVQGAYSPRKD